MRLSLLVGVLLLTLYASAAAQEPQEPQGPLPTSTGLLDTLPPSARQGTPVDITCGNTRAVVGVLLECLAIPADASRYAYFWSVRGVRGRHAGFDEGNRAAIFRWEPDAAGEHQIRLFVTHAANLTRTPLIRTLRIRVDHDGNIFQRIWRHPVGKAAVVMGVGAVGWTAYCARPGIQVGCMVRRVTP